MSTNEMTAGYTQYIKSIENQLSTIYQIAEKAREKGLDPCLKPETEIAKDLAALVEGLVGPPGVARSIRELSQKLPREELAFKIAEEIVYGKYEHMESQRAADQAVRTALAILTEGITAAPLQGVAKVAVKQNFDHTNYLAIYFAGPIRSAGGTDQALSLVVGDFVRRLLRLDRYKPTEEEISRFIEEVRLYERSVLRFQYHVSDAQLHLALESLPIEVTGTETDQIEVSSFRNLPRIETNRVRGGALRVVNDGVVGRAAKVSTIIDKLGLEGWDWLKTIGTVGAGKKNKEERKVSGFMDDVIAGRPIFSFPSRAGGFRLRYGRARNTGLAAVGVHPATMLVLDQFIAAGTQLRIELPGKGGVVLPVDSIEPPIVRLEDGTVTRVALHDFERIRDKIAKVLFLGDMLVSYGDFLYNNKPLMPSGYTEEWWCQELWLAVKERFNNSVEDAAIAVGMSKESLVGFLEKPLQNKPTVEEAIRLSTVLNIPLHPRFTYFWSNIDVEKLSLLRHWLLNAQCIWNNNLILEIIGKFDNVTKRLLEKICIPHTVDEDNIKIVGEDAQIFACCVGLGKPTAKVSYEKSVLENLKEFAGFVIREKAPTYIGARMGRPEKAKERIMKPLVHALFPVGLAGGAQRDLIEATKKETVTVEVTRRRCTSCGGETFKIKCPVCNADTISEYFCPMCGRTFHKETVCPNCRTPTKGYVRQNLNLREFFDSACKRLEVSFPEKVKGVKGLTNETKTPEILEKGILRARYDLSVFKDGTVRFDATNAPLTHFKPCEVGVSLEQLRHMGYTTDYVGNPLTDPGQVCELRIQDVIIPRKCGEYFVRVANFVDDLLEKGYGVSRYYNVRRVEDLIGHLVIGLAPHTSVGIIGRIVGFTTHNVCYAHPVWHSAKRRDCDGDEDALMLALDVLLNFSRVFLPAQIGGIMDAPFFVMPFVNPAEVQRQAHDVDVAAFYPLEFYEKTLQKVSARSVVDMVDLIGHRLASEAQFEGFNYTISVSDINMGNSESMYKKLGKMLDKLNSQLGLAEKIAAVDARVVARKVLTTHFMRDIAGNLRAFSTQGFRCKSCNKRFRRLPLKAKCPECNGNLSLTVYRGGIEKYLEAAHHLIKNYRLPQYYAQRLDLVKDEIDSLFEGKKPRQICLTDFA
ncbi:MAG: DNA polymerase II large subunit [Candidatus Bathyarchaeia archaeon]|nr:DNA polymerase II large subunit [Candidatus Bathyarchaeota archaeon]